MMASSKARNPKARAEKSGRPRRSEATAQKGTLRTRRPRAASLADCCTDKVIHLDRVTHARAHELSPHVVESMSRLFKALSDPSRIRIVMALSRGEMCVCDLAAFLAISQSAVSHQLRKLRDLCLVRARRDRQVLYYALDDDHVQVLLEQALDHVLHDSR